MSHKVGRCYRQCCQAGSRALQTGSRKKVVWCAGREEKVGKAKGRRRQAGMAGEEQGGKWWEGRVGMLQTKLEDVESSKAVLRESFYIVKVWCLNVLGHGRKEKGV